MKGRFNRQQAMTYGMFVNAARAAKEEADNQAEIAVITAQSFDLEKVMIEAFLANERAATAYREYYLGEEE